jgi:transcription factor E
MPTKRKSRAKRASTPEREEAPREVALSTLVKDVAGEAGSKVLQSIGDGATDETIEKATGLKLSQVRSLLNHLHSYGLVEYTREKNLQTGWFTYTWRANLERFFQNFLTMKKREYEALREKLASAEGAQFYKCKKECTRMPFEEAMDLRFKCPTCRQAMNFVKTEDELAQIERHIGALQNVLSRSQPARVPTGRAS